MLLIGSQLKNIKSVSMPNHRGQEPHDCIRTHLRELTQTIISYLIQENRGDDPATELGELPDIIVDFIFGQEISTCSQFSIDLDDPQVRASIYEQSGKIAGLMFEIYDK